MSTKKIKKRVKAKKVKQEEELLNEIFKDVDQAYYDPKEINALFQEDNVVISPTLKEKVQAGDNTLKDMIVEYVGNDTQPENGEVTVEMVVQTMSRDFPEFLLAVAEENWIRGYHQALYDSDLGKKILEEQNKEIYENNVQIAKGFSEAKNKTVEKANG